jgi:hypothetical protein
MKFRKTPRKHATKPTKLNKGGFVAFVAPYLAYIYKSLDSFVAFVAPYLGVNKK